jgi:hypothetical protein
VQLISESYKEISRVIKQEKVEVEKTFKRGDPLSLFIFNMVFEPLLLQLESLPRYKIRNHAAVSSLAFANDLILVATDTQCAECLLPHTEEYINSLDMKLSAIYTN